MYHVYTLKNHSEFSKTLVAETKDYDLALQKAQKAVEGKEGYNYVVEETDGSMNSYGELIATVVAEGQEHKSLRANSANIKQTSLLDDKE